MYNDAGARNLQIEAGRTGAIMICSRAETSARLVT